MSGKPWYTNGERNIQIDVNKGEEIPDGFYPGRYISPDKIAQRSSKLKNTMSNKVKMN